MNATVHSSDWASVDPWWQLYTTDYTVGYDPTIGTLSSERAVQTWDEIADWNREYVSLTTIAHRGMSPSVANTEQFAAAWRTIDPWWGVYSKAGNEIAKKLTAVLEQSTAAWNAAPGPFETDPLATDLARTQTHRGPLHPEKEVEWSQWLAQLLRPSGTLMKELFETSIEQAPDEVLREDPASREDGGFRRADLVIRRPEQSISIEVKLDDRNYRKTAETAKLLERKYEQDDWIHVLLLPEQNRRPLAETVAPPIEKTTDGALQIKWDEPRPIRVLYWRDVSAAIRAVLKRGDVVDEHWAANAYLFCAVLEQQVLEFRPQPVVEQLAAPSDVVNKLRSVGITGQLDEQLTYLRTRLET